MRPRISLLVVIFLFVSGFAIVIPVQAQLNTFSPIATLSNGTVGIYNNSKGAELSVNAFFNNNAQDVYVQNMRYQILGTAAAAVDYPTCRLYKSNGTSLSSPDSNFAGQQVGHFDSYNEGILVMRTTSLSKYGLFVQNNTSTALALVCNTTNVTGSLTVSWFSYSARPVGLIWPYQNYIVAANSTVYNICDAAASVVITISDSVEVTFPNRLVGTEVSAFHIQSDSSVLFHQVGGIYYYIPMGLSFSGDGPISDITIKFVIDPTIGGPLPPGGVYHGVTKVRPNGTEPCEFHLPVTAAIPN